MTMEENDIVKEGLLQKKRNRLNTWAPRYFILRRNCLEYYIKQADSVGSYPYYLQTMYELYITCLSVMF
ncbi:hypothetical protein EON65_56355 [archaeon]|nr:MAG: hypothetical protein EON65_56355 [archaeon]